MIHVLIMEPGGTVRTVPTDFVTASRLVRAATFEGKKAIIVPWTKSDTQDWRGLLDNHEGVTVSIAVCDGTCKCTLRPSGDRIMCFVPYGVEVLLPDGSPITFQRPTIPQGTAEAPNLTHGAPTEEAGDA